MTRIVALGDSITMGMGDPAPDGGWRGWTEHLASGLADPELHNLAACAPSAARVCSSGSGSPDARCCAQPRQPPPGAGSPMPMVIESPRVTIRVMPIPARECEAGRC